MSRSAPMRPTGCSSTITNANSVLSLAWAIDCTPRTTSHFGRRRDTRSYALRPSTPKAAICSVVSTELLREPPDEDVPDAALAQPRVHATAITYRCCRFIIDPGGSCGGNCHPANDLTNRGLLR